jgi:hypothetical protein
VNRNTENPISGTLILQQTHMLTFTKYSITIYTSSCVNRNIMFPEKTVTERLLISEQGPTCFLTLFLLSEVTEPHNSAQHHCSLLSASQSIG